MLLRDCCCSLGSFHHDSLHTFEGFDEYSPTCRCKSNLKTYWKSLKGGYGVITGHGGFEMVLEGDNWLEVQTVLGQTRQVQTAHCSVVTGCEKAKREHIKEINFPTLRIYS